MAQRYCTNCGTQLEPHDRFCPSCRTLVRETGEINEAKPNPQPRPPPASSGSDPDYAREAKAGERLPPAILVALAVVLGPFAFFWMISKITGASAHQIGFWIGGNLVLWCSWPPCC